MLALITSALCASHVPVTRLQNSGGTLDTLVVSAMVHGAVDSKETVYLNFGSSPSFVAGRLCPGEVAGEVPPMVPVYYERSAYWVECAPQSDASVVAFQAFNREGVTLTDDAIEFCSPTHAGAKRLIATSNCTDLLACVFQTVTEEGAQIHFKVNPSARQHHIHDNMTGAITKLGRGDTPILIDTRLYNTYERCETNEMITIATGYANTFVHFDGTNHSIWSVEEVDSVSNLFTMALMLIGAIMFVPTSVRITDHLYGQKDEGLKAAVELIGNPNELMHAVVVDFSTSAACVCVYLAYSNGLGNGTFKSTASEEMTAVGDAVIAFYTVLSSVLVVWCVIRCHMSLTNDDEMPWLVERLAALIGRTKEQMKSTPSVVHVVVARIGFEYAVVVAFMASCPIRMGSGFVQCVYLVASAVLLIAIGRDSNILIRDMPASPAETLLIVVVAATSSYPLALYGIKPLVEAARSFSSTLSVTWSVTIAITVTFLSAGASSLKGRLKVSLIPDECDYQK